MREIYVSIKRHVSAECHHAKNVDFQDLIDLCLRKFKKMSAYNDMGKKRSNAIKR